jgi:hypothetical protein
MEESMSTYRASYLSVAVVLLAASSLPAQAQDEAPLRMIYAVWKDTEGAGYAMDHMSKTARDQVEAFAVLTKDKAGKVEVKQRYNQAGGSVRALQASQVVDTAIARLTAPPTSAADSASGYAPEAPARRLSEADLKKVVGMFGPGQSALILMSPKPAISQIERSLGVGGMSNAEIVELEIKE